MTKPDRMTPRFQRHHLIISLVAIVVAIALVLNYYLW
jgi:hypothetical protein